MAGTNALSGKQSQQAIYDSSLFLQYYMKPNPNGRKSLISSEFMDWSKDNLTGLTLVDRSLFILLPIIYPEIYMFAEDDLLRQGIKGCLKYITETARSVEGFQDIAIDVQTPTFKTPFFNLPLFTNLQNPTNEITLTIPADLSGYFITNQIRHWLNAISDEYSRTAPYNGLTMDYNNWSHSCGMAYIKPNKNLTKVDYGALFFLMIPKGAPTSNFNADATSPGVAELSLTFNVNMVDSRNLKIKEICESLLAKYRNIIVMESSLYGIINNTYAQTQDEIDVDSIMEQLVSME